MSPDSNTPVLDEIIQSKIKYKRLQKLWFALHYLSGIIAILSGALAGISSSSEVPIIIQQNTWIWGLLATIFGGVVTFLNPFEKAKLYKISYYELLTGIQKYHTESIDLKVLVSILEKSQNRVLGLYKTET